MKDENDPFLPGPGVLLSMSTCAVIGEVVARELRAAGASYSTDAILNAMELPDDPAVLLDAAQVSALLSIKTGTVYELSRRRLDPLPSVSIGRAKRFDRGAVSRWVERQGSRS